jgi:hypothetical protein
MSLCGDALRQAWGNYLAFAQLASIRLAGRALSVRALDGPSVRDISEMERFLPRVRKLQHSSSRRRF